MPARDPYPLAVLKGYAGAPPLRPRPEPKPPACPSWVPAEGRREWRRLVPILDRAGVLSHLDRAVLASFCTTYARLVEAEKAISDRGILVEGYRGSIVKNPAVQVARDARAALVVLARELGLSPKAREALRVPLDDDIEDDDL